ncbi:MAG: DUF6607 family protein [Salibacteraceae bacterium]
MKKTTTLFSMFAAFAAIAQPATDKEAIKSMCGCYKVSFDYAETFAADTNYELHDQYHAKASAEWIFVEEESDDKIVIQHLLVVSDTVIIKHWRQDWLYENRDFHHFHKDRTWNYAQAKPEAVKGQWTQKVYQVDDSPRYEGSATWVHVDGKHFWENTTDAPLPRREFSKRSDYNVMERTNRHEITNEGWLHEQDNLKIVRSAEGDKVIVAEKGLNNYVKTDDSKCEAARHWWKENSVYWALVRAEWDKVFAQQEDLQLAKKVDDKMLWQTLFAMGDEWKSKVQSEPKKASAEIAATIDAFVKAAAETGLNE